MENWTLVDYLILVFWLWIFWMTIRVIVTIEKIKSQAITDKAQALVKEHVIPAVMEHYKGQIFLYNKQTGTFIVQATSEEDLKTKLNQWFPRKAFIVVEQQHLTD